VKRYLGVLTVAALLVLTGCGRNAPPPAVNPDMARSYKAASEALRTSQGNTDDAVQALSKAKAQDQDNAMTAYLFAAALAKRKDWQGVSREIKAGNQAPHCVYYVDDTPFRVMPGMGSIRELARAAAAAAPSLGTDKGAELLTDMRVMAKKVAGAEPVGVVPVIVGGVVREISDKALVSLYTKEGRNADADRARTRQEADKAWLDGARADARAIEDKTDLSTLIRKHFTEEEWKEYDNGKHVTPAIKVRLDGIRDEVDSIERPLAQKLLKSMPD
jgi:hypothetical protein